MLSLFRFSVQGRVNAPFRVCCSASKPVGGYDARSFSEAGTRLQRHDETLRRMGPSIHFFQGGVQRGTVRTTLHLNGGPEIIAKFEELVPFETSLFHTVSSGRNLAFLMPRLSNQVGMSSSPGDGYHARSSAEAGTLFWRHDQMLVLTLGGSQDHGAYMRPVASVVKEDLHALNKFADVVWDEQLRGESKVPCTLSFTAASDRADAAEVPLLRDPPTGNEVVDEAAAVIRSLTKQHWLKPPLEVVRLMSTGDARGVEGTDGYLFPPMVIANGVLMVLSTYAHSGIFNILATEFENGIAEQHLLMLKSLFRKIAEPNLAYLRALGLVTICNGFDTFLAAMDQAGTVDEVRTLLGSLSLFGTLMHGHVVYQFPYRLGLELRRQSSAGDNWFSVECSSVHTLSVPLRARDGRGLGVATWEVGAPAEREKLSANTHLPEKLQAATVDLPLVVRLQPSASSIPVHDLAVAARPIIEEHLPAKGAVLFRGLPLPTFSEAGEFLASLGYEMYPDPSGRDRVAFGLYHASLAVPPDFNISPHQEHIVSVRPPSKLFLYCQAPSAEGGQTPLAHAAAVWDLLPQGTRDLLCRRLVRYEMLRGNAANPENPVRYTRSWQEHFSTDDLQTAIDKASGEFGGTVMGDRHGNIILRSQPLQVFRLKAGTELYYTQLQNCYSLKWIWGDVDEDIPEYILEDVMSAVWGAATVFQWKAGDVLVVDNETVLHGRLSYKGDRYMGAGLTRD